MNKDIFETLWEKYAHEKRDVFELIKILNSKGVMDDWFTQILYRSCEEKLLSEL